MSGQHFGLHAVTSFLLLHHCLGDGVTLAQNLEAGQERDPKQGRSSTSLNADKFSRGWWDGYFHSGAVGCQLTEGYPHTYRWRGTDWGANIDGLVLTWSRAIMNGTGDIAVIVAPGGHAPPSACTADGTHEDGAARVWASFFAPMAHLCFFSSQQEWHDFVATSGVDLPPDDQQLGMNEEAFGDVPHTWDQDTDFRSASEGVSTDPVRVMARVLHHMLSHIQPRLQGEVQAVLHETNKAFFSGNAGKYVGMYVRKTDGRMHGKVKATETLVCFERAWKYLEDLDKFSADYILASDIVGISIVSEDSTALAEAKRIAPRYFRKAKSDTFVHVAVDPVSSTAGAGVAVSDVCGISDVMGDGHALTQLLAELQSMAKAAVFVGVASESFGRLVFLMRETLQLPRTASLSMDKKTPFPGRHSRRRG